LKGLVLVSFPCLACGAGVLLAFCKGNTGMSLASPVTNSSFHIDITASGVPMLGGVGLTLLGLFLLAIAWLLALGGMLRRSDAPRRREEPFRD